MPELIMRMREDFVATKVSALLLRLAKLNGTFRPPIDLQAVLEILDIRSERRNMIPEGVLCVDKDGFKVFLQSNFEDRASVRLRQRFTLAHEIIHTFFYERKDDDVPKPIGRGPRGERLEALCHYGAGKLLVPDELLGKEVGIAGVCSAKQVIELAETFEVSVEVMMRSIRQHRTACASDFALTLVEQTAEGPSRIVAAFHSASLLPHLPDPDRGADFDAWVQPLLENREAVDDGWRSITPAGQVIWRECPRTSRSFLAEFRFALANVPLSDHTVSSRHSGA